MTLIIDPSAVKRIKDLRQAQARPGLMLRVIVDGGGCAGFQYKLELTESHAPEEQVFEGTVVTDDISLPYLKDAVVRFEESLVGAAFKIDNPNAKSGCGCGTSFAV